MYQKSFLLSLLLLVFSKITLAAQIPLMVKPENSNHLGARRSAISSILQTFGSQDGDFVTFDFRAAPVAPIQNSMRFLRISNQEATKKSGAHEGNSIVPWFFLDKVENESATTVEFTDASMQVDSAIFLVSALKYLNRVPLNKK